MFFTLDRLTLSSVLAFLLFFSFPPHQYVGNSTTHSQPFCDQTRQTYCEHTGAWVMTNGKISVKILSKRIDTDFCMRSHSISKDPFHFIHIRFFHKRIRSIHRFKSENRFVELIFNGSKSDHWDTLFYSSPFAHINLKNSVQTMCGGLALAKCQVPTKSLYHFPPFPLLFSTGQRGERK